MINLAADRLRGLTRYYRSIFSKAWETSGTRIFLPLILGFLGLVLNINAIALATWYVHRLISNIPVSILGETYLPRESVEFLAAISLGCLVLFSLAALSNYFHNAGVIKLSTAVERRCIASVIHSLTEPHTLRGMLGAHDTESAIIKIILNDSRSLSRAILMTIWAIVPFCTALVSVFVLFFVDWRVTLGLVPVVGAYVYFLQGVNLSGISHGKAFEKFSGKVRELIVLFMRDLKTGKDPVREESPATMGKALDSYLDAYRGLITLTYRSHFLSDLLLGLAVTFVLATLAGAAIIGMSNWSSVLAYLVALRFGISSLRQCAARLTTANRFKPQVERLANLRAAVDPVRPAPTNLMELTALPPKQGGTQVKIQKGEPALLYTKISLNYFTIHSLINSLFPIFKSNFAHNVSFIKSSSEFQKPLESVEWYIIDSTVLKELTPNDWGNFIVTCQRKFIIITDRNLNILKDSPIPLSATTPVIVVGSNEDVLWSGNQSDLKTSRSQIAEHFRAAGTRKFSDEAAHPEYELDLELA